MLSYENALWRKGIEQVAGADEVGRGAFAGPVVAAVVSFVSATVIIPEEIIIRDSKKMTALQRTRSSAWLTKNCNFGIGEGSVAKINNTGIVEATNDAFWCAIKNIGLEIDHLLIDGLELPEFKNQTAIVRGDSKSLSIAAASIIAKVYRDDLMMKLGQQKKYQSYLWHKNKGYGTVEHRSALSEHGATKHHRELFVRKFI